MGVRERIKHWAGRLWGAWGHIDNVWGLADMVLRIVGYVGAIALVVTFLLQVFTGFLASQWQWIVMGAMLAIAVLAQLMAWQVRRRDSESFLRITESASVKNIALSEDERLDSTPAADTQAQGEPERIGAAGLVDQLSDLIVEGDSYVQALLGRGAADLQLRDIWTIRAEALVDSRLGHSAAADFQTARRPEQRDTGHHAQETWQKLDRTMAQLELLKRFKRELEAGTRTLPPEILKPRNADEAENVLFRPVAMENYSFLTITNGGASQEFRAMVNPSGNVVWKDLMRSPYRGMWLGPRGTVPSTQEQKDACVSKRLLTGERADLALVSLGDKRVKLWAPEGSGGFYIAERKEGQLLDMTFTVELLRELDGPISQTFRITETGLPAGDQLVIREIDQGEASETAHGELSDAIAEADDLIRVTPSQGSGQMPTGQGNTVSEVVAYLDVETADTSTPLRNCRIKLLDLHHYMAYTDLDKGEVVERWDKDVFYAGQTYFFRWSGRAETIDAVDIHSRERASIARCLDTRSAELTTTSGPAGHMFHGDQYHLVVEVTAENAQPVTKEYWLQMHQGNSPLIKEWDESRTTWL